MDALTIRRKSYSEKKIPGKKVLGHKLKNQIFFEIFNYFLQSL